MHVTITVNFGLKAGREFSLFSRLPLLVLEPADLRCGSPFVPCMTIALRGADRTKLDPTGLGVLDSEQLLRVL